ncbi:MAG: YlbF family regulator [Bacillota bacterium]|jgi:cell fate (sporulation/competence/biofilm development) regulator YlbF (YheA/YmcA/DUF963 family)
MILEKARDLGLALSESQEFSRMQSARAVLDANEAVTSTLQDYQQKQEQLLDLLSGDNPDRLQVAALSRDVETLQEQLLSNPVFSEAMEAQNAFSQLMAQVNREISACIGVQQSEGGCGGSCSGCSGCH